MRVFIAIEIDDHLRKQLSDIQQNIAKHAELKKGDVKWVPPENIHLTLKFLGEITDSETNDICKAVEKICSQYDSFELDVETVGSFGKSAKVVWVGINDSPQLNKLVSKIENALEKMGFEKEKRKFTAHLTLARVRSFRAGRKIKETLDDFAGFRGSPITVDSINVIKSDLTRSGAKYTLLSKSKLL